MGWGRGPGQGGVDGGTQCILLCTLAFKGWTIFGLINVIEPNNCLKEIEQLILNQS
jgi:hypothetical protein